jgi:PAS domain S-box-containing protein
MDGVLDWLPGPREMAPFHVLLDGLIAAAYFAIAMTIWWFVRRRTDLRPAHRRTALLFVAFITACGLIHLAAVLVGRPHQGLQAAMQTVTAVVAMVIAAVLPFLAPKLLAVASPGAMKRANDRLREEAAAHQATLRALEDAHGRLERQVADREEELRLTNARFTTAIRGSTVTVLEQDEELRYTWMFNAFHEAEGLEFLGKTERELLDEPDAEALQALKREVLETGELRQRELAIAPGGRPRWIHLRVQPTLLQDGRRGILAVATDITVQKRQQAHLELVMRELNHRSKNLLTIVQAIARQTAAGLEVPPEFLRRLGDRLKALASAHDVLVAGDWRGANLQAVIESQLRHQMQGLGGRLRLDGEPFDLPPEMAHYVGLAIHELGANALKYGALSADDGRVEVRWWVVGEGATRTLRLVWREFGGPRVETPRPPGFGRTILEALIPRAFGGEAELAFAEEGVSWSLTAPLPG